MRIAPDQHVGDRARYRYEIEATVTRALEGARPETSEITATLLVDQRIVSVDDDGAEAEITLRRHGAPSRTARVRLDRAGALRGVELVEGLSAATSGLAQVGALLPPTIAPPHRPLRPGATWVISDGLLDGRGRLERLGVIDGVDVAVVAASASRPIEEAVAAGTSVATLSGTLRTVCSVAYGLDDGSLRRSSSRSQCQITARIEPPPGVSAAPVVGTIGCDIRVRATRLR